MAKGKVTDTDKGWAKAVKRLKGMANGMHVVAGIRGEKGSKKHEGPDGEGTFTVVDIGAVHEFGTDDGHVPERSYLRATFDANKGRYGKLLEGSLGKVVDGTTTLEVELERLGVKVAGDVQHFIQAGEGPPPALAASTIARKKSSHALIQNSQLIQSIDSEVRQGSATKGIAG